MKKLSTYLCLIASGFLFAVPMVHAEMAKEGSGNYRGGESGTFAILKMEGGHFQMNWEETGVMVEVPQNSPFFNASWHAMGTTCGDTEKVQGNGAILLTRPNGDQIFGTMSYEGKPGGGPTSGLVTWVGGTGECTGIGGTMELLPRPTVKVTKKGIYQQIAVGKISWKIP
ncbi:MAG: hypothetical protein AMJ54_15925 [Deltaproteobacteria bacterium SG8_13]|nr:MAG: hypothetical protein AMJ54_15925 [Deltaproteobacteria bacterium SG8_13]